jgi:hypothetical protein
MLMWHHLRASRSRSGEKIEEATTLTLQSKPTKIYNDHFDFFSNPKHKPLDFFFSSKDGPRHQPQP